MGYEGGGLRINGQGITDLIMVKERPTYQGLSYGHKELGECFKLFEVKKPPEEDMSHQDYNSPWLKVHIIKANKGKIRP